MDASLVGNKSGSVKFHTINPATLGVIKEYSYLSEMEVETAIARSQSAQREWSQTTSLHRSNCFVKLAASLRKHKNALALQMAHEMGKPIKDGRSEVEKCAFTCEFYAEQADWFLNSESISLGEREQKVVKESLGPVLAIMPWNFPLWQVVRSLVPILAGGNTYLLKHSMMVAGCAELMTAIFQEVFGPGVVENLFVDHEQAAKIIADPRVRAVTMTGSSRGGREVAATAGRYLKKVLLELGGSDPYVVLEDADLEKAVIACTQSRLINNGQSCVAAKRFFVPQNLQNRFTDQMIKIMDQVKIASPEMETTDLGPLASIGFVEGLTRQVQQIQKEGARKIWQRENMPTSGAYFPPTVILCSGDEPSFLKEEFFGPVALVYSYDNLEEALRLANASIYGLGGAVFSQNQERAEAVARELECGFVAINDVVRSDPRLPFGGIKDSGFGRELGLWGVNEFVNTKTITYG